MVGTYGGAMSEFKDFKEMEAGRIQPLLGAISALPGAALVLGKDASAGAPLLIVALAFAAAAYVFWVCSDSVFAQHYDYDCAGQRTEAEKTANGGRDLSWATFGYGSASLLCTALAFAAIHSTLRTPLSVEAGFVVAMVTIFGTIYHCVHAIKKRDALTRD